MPTTSSTRDEIEIRDRIGRWTQALHAQDLDALMSLYAPDVVVFDVTPPHRVVGADQYRRNFERWFAEMPTIEYETHELCIKTGEDVAFHHALGHVQAVRSNGEKVDYWVRVTVGFEKRNGEWLMIHDHVSMPFDMKSAKAVRELRP